MAVNHVCLFTRADIIAHIDRIGAGMSAFSDALQAADGTELADVLDAMIAELATLRAEVENA